MAQFTGPPLQISVSPISPVAASSTSSGGVPAPPPPPPSARAGGAGAGAGAGASAATPTSQSAHHPHPPQHKRVYQACIPCRRRKVRCDLGSVDDPHDPPCVRCRRESKECYFSATRRKRKVDDGSVDEDLDHDDYILRNGRKQLRRTSSPTGSTFDRRLYSDVPLTPGGSQGRSQPLRRPGDGSKSARSNSTGEFGNGEPNTPLENFEARAVMRKEVYGPQDALDLLYKAATEELVHPPCFRLLCWESCRQLIWWDLLALHHINRTRSWPLPKPPRSEALTMPANTPNRMCHPAPQHPGGTTAATPHGRIGLQQSRRLIQC
jgi:hypothetical protein